MKFYSATITPALLKVIVTYQNSIISGIDFSKLPLLAFDNMPSERIGKIELYLRYLAHCGYSQTSHYLDIGYKSGGKEDKELNSKNEFYKKLIYDFGYLEQKARDIAER